MKLLIEGRECETCGKVSINEHMCRVEETGATFDCEYCGATGVTYGHLCKARIDVLKYYCGFCGRVSIKKDFVCEPIEIPKETKNAWENAEFEEDLAISCENCGQPIIMPGHICDIKVKVYTDKYCNKEIDTTKLGVSSHHMCPEKYKKAKYFCRLCGRLGVEPWEICTPIKLK